MSGANTFAVDGAVYEVPQGIDFNPADFYEPPPEYDEDGNEIEPLSEARKPLAPGELDRRFAELMGEPMAVAPETTPVLISRFTKPANKPPLSKHFLVNEKGELDDDRKHGVLSDGVVEVIACNGLRGLAEVMKSCTAHQALSIGVATIHGLRQPSGFSSKIAKEGSFAQDSADIISRSAKNFTFDEGRPGFLFIDFDTKDAPQEVEERLRNFGSLFDCLVALAPGLAGAGYVVRASSRGGISNSATGEAYRGSNSQHLFVTVKDAGDIKRATETLHKRAWLKGFGWIAISRAGSLLPRSIVDTAVASPERLIFEGAPVLEPPLVQDPKAREPMVVDGTVVDTRTAIPPLTAQEEAEFSRLVAEAKAKVEPEAEVIRAEHNAQLVERNIARGLNAEEAKRLADAQYRGRLGPDHELVFDDRTIGVKTVAEVLANLDFFDGKTLADPVEGPSYGRCKAKVYQKANGGGFINSWAHGGSKYHLYADPDELLREVEGWVDWAGETDETSPPLIAPRVVSGTAAVLLDVVDTHANAERIYAALNVPVPMFRHGGCLKYIGEEELPPTPSGPNEPPHTKGAITSAFIPVKQDWLRAQASKHIQFSIQKDKKVVPIRTPTRELQDLIAAPELFGAPVVHQIVEAPFLTPSGDVISAKGYHPDQRIYLSSSLNLKGMVPDAPTRKDALIALGNYKDCLLAEFPFVDDASRSAAMSMILTLLLRNLMSNAPMNGCMAPTPGTGKTFLQMLAMLIAFNRDLPVSSAGKAEEELEKRLDAMMMAGHPVIALDNVNGVLKGDKLCQILSQSEVTCRPLGKSEAVKVVNRASVMANGNNIRLPDDMVRRSILCSLDANTDRPETRHFKVAGEELRAAVTRDRALWIARAFTIVRAFLHALKRGDAELVAPLNGFEGWSAFVRSPLVWLDMADPVATQEAIRSDDPERAKRAAIFGAFAEITRDPAIGSPVEVVLRDALAGLWQDSGMGSGHFISSHRLRPQVDVLIEHVPRRPGQQPTLEVVTRSLAYYFRHNANAVAGGYKLLKGSLDRNGVQRWKVEPHNENG